MPVLGLVPWAALESLRVPITTSPRTPSSLRWPSSSRPLTSTRPASRSRERRSTGSPISPWILPEGLQLARSITCSAASRETIKGDAG
eukprot:9180585-Pyramimonas_sp.AAC.1